MGACGFCCPEFNFVVGASLVVGIIITYEPDGPTLRRTVDSLITQVDDLLMIDNGSSLNVADMFNGVDRLTCIQLQDNCGIAKAQNLGIVAARAKGADYVVLSDQDTEYLPNTISGLIEVFSRWPEAAAVVPKFNDLNKAGRDGFILANSAFFTPSHLNQGEYELRQAIASGQVIRLSALEQVGFMMEDLFIDWVDIEWCWRARSLGYQIIGAANIVVNHSLGDESRNLGYREVNLRSPIRHYYITRNAFSLAFRSPHLNLGLRSVLLLRSLRYLIGFPLLSPPRVKNLRAVVAGLSDAIRGKLGKTSRFF